MIGTRIGNYNNINFEIIFGITGNDFQIIDIITENNSKINDKDIQYFIKDTENILSTWDNPINNYIEYANYLNTNNIQIIEE